MAYTQSTNGIALVSLEGTLHLWTYLLEKREEDITLMWK
jgi:hypothetical protein